MRTQDWDTVASLAACTVFCALVRLERALARVGGGGIEWKVGGRGADGGYGSEKRARAEEGGSSRREGHIDPQQHAIDLGSGQAQLHTQVDELGRVRRMTGKVLVCVCLRGGGYLEGRCGDVLFRRIRAQRQVRETCARDDADENRQQQQRRALTRTRALPALVEAVLAESILALATELASVTFLASPLEARIIGTR